MHSTIYNSQDTESTTYSSVEEWVKNVVHIYSTALLSLKTEQTAAPCRDTVGPIDWRIEWTETEREKNHILTHTCGIWKNGTDEPVCKAEIETQM